LSQSSVQQSALLAQVESGGAQVALRQVQTLKGEKRSIQPQILEQQSVFTSQLASTARHGAARHVPFSQMPLQHWD
jgi:hypothetical protein